MCPASKEFVEPLTSFAMVHVFATQGKTYAVQTESRVGKITSKWM